MSGREILRVLLGSWSGRTGVLFLAVLVFVSLAVVIVLPLNFGSQRWNNPAEWADNPKAAAPGWTTLWPGNDAASHRIFDSSIPREITQVGPSQQRTYAFDLDYDGGALPTFMSFALSDVRFASQPPQISVEVLRPDGRSIQLYRDVVRGPRPGEQPPYARHFDEPLRINLSGSRETLESAARFLGREFDVQSTAKELAGKAEQVVFGTPTSANLDGFTPLAGRYRFEVQVLAASPGDTIGGVKLVLAGTTFGFMGTDATGRDLALGLLFGFPVALTIGLVTSLLVTTIGTFMGIVSGFLGGKTDLGIQRFSDIWSNIPLLPVLIFLIFVLGQRLWLVVVIMILFGWPGLAIVVRSMVLQIRSGQLVEATRALGASRLRIMFRHILFQIAPFVFAQMIFFTPAAILAEAGLSFLGLGDPSIPTWGQILESGFRTSAVYLGYWWWILPPGILIVITAMTFVLLTLGLEPVINPRLRRAR